MINRIDFLKRLGAIGAGVLTGRLVQKNLPVRKEIFRAYIRGLQHYGGLKIAKQMLPGERLQLIREPENKHDPCAIAIYYRGDKIGYFPAEDNVVLSNMMDAASFQFEAEVEFIDRNAPYWERISFVVYAV
jgi:hypothetical protein